MATSPEASPEDCARQRQRQIDLLTARARFEATDAAVEQVARAGVIAAFCGHVALVALGAWLMTRGGSMIGTFGSGCLLADAILCMFTIVAMVRIALEYPPLRGALIGISVAGACVAIPTVLASFFGKLGPLPFQPLSLQGGVLILAMLAFLAFYGVASVWLAWLLSCSAVTVRKSMLLRESP